jgi:hypothetical protein
MIEIWETLSSVATIAVPVSSHFALHLQLDLQSIEPVIGEALAHLFERLAYEGFYRVELPGIVALKVVAVSGTGIMKAEAAVVGSSKVRVAGSMSARGGVKPQDARGTNLDQIGSTMNKWIASQPSSSKREET